MSYRFHVLVLLLWSVLSGVATAGWWETGNPGGTGLHGRFGDFQVGLKGRLTGFKVTGKHGKTEVVHLPRAQGLDQAISLPEGSWDEITLFLDGPVTVRASDGVIKLQVDSITVALEDPDAAQVHLDWTLPADDTSLRGSPTRLLQALEDGALARP